MSVINSQPLIGASGNQGAAYNLTRSLRFRNSASAYLSRTPASSGSLTTFTYSTWVKRGRLDIDGYLFSAVKTGPTATDAIRFNSDGTFGVFYEGSGTVYVKTSSVYRDPSAWYHVVVQIDTTQATAANRIRIYFNGSQVTSLATTNYPAQNATFPAWNRSVLHTIGNDAQIALHADQYLAETYFIDGQSLTPSSFGETSATTGVWIPKAYTGSYGTNGFYLDFEDTSSVAALGYDAAGSNDWTVNNVSLTSGATYDSMTDVPTLTSATAANYAVINPLVTGSYVILSNGNLTTTGNNAADNGNFRSSIAFTTGKWYLELTCLNDIGASNNPRVGILPVINASLPDNGATNSVGNATNSCAYYRNGQKFIAGTASSYGASWTTNDVIGVAIDADNGTLVFYKNNTSQGTAFTWTGGTITFVVAGSEYNGTSSAYNFGQRPFAYTPPTGFVALNTFNLPTPTIGATASSQANKYFDSKLYTGTGSSLNVTGLSFQPDLVWIKERSGAADHALYDAVRGVQKQLESNTTTAETTETTGLTALNSDGFTVGALAQVNTNTDTYVAWAWDANGVGSSNTSGTITSTVSANTSAGFSIVTYTGTGVSNATVGHGLGVAPKMVILKARTTNATSNNWWVNHSSLTSGNNLYLNTTDAQFAVSGTTSGGLGTMNSTIFTLANGVSTNSNTNETACTYVAYCFAEVAGYSKFGSYTGNGSTDGPFIYLGFKPKYVMFKNISVSGAWEVYDTSRNTFNTTDNYLLPNAADAEGVASNRFDYLSNGVKVRNTGGSINGSGNTIIYAAFAETPTKFANAR
jgi:hypothetical protein